jgi:hypothetical protein
MDTRDTSDISGTSDTSTATEAGRPGTDPEELRHDRRLLRQLRATQGLADLLATRPDLRGVHPPADLVDDAVRWCA